MPEGVVAMLDALGVTGMWARSSPETVERQVKNWQEIIAIFHTFASGVLSQPDIVRRCQVYSFSDTIIIVMEGEPSVDADAPTGVPGVRTPDLLMLMGEALKRAFYTALTLGVFFRGAITAGTFHESLPASRDAAGSPSLGQPLLIGPAIDNVAEWYEQADWMGVLVTPNATYHLTLLDSLAAGSPVHQAYTKHHIPIKQGRDGSIKPRELWALAWPQFAVATTGSVTEARAQVLTAFAIEPIGLAPLSKYEHTLQFFETCCGAKDVRISAEDA